MANLEKSTRVADSVREECLCVRDCSPACAYTGRWHTHASDACPVHPTAPVE